MKGFKFEINDRGYVLKACKLNAFGEETDKLRDVTEQDLERLGYIKMSEYDKLVAKYNILFGQYVRCQT